MLGLYFGDNGGEGTIPLRLHDDTVTDERGIIRAPILYKTYVRPYLDCVQTWSPAMVNDLEIPENVPVQQRVNGSMV